MGVGKVRLPISSPRVLWHNAKGGGQEGLALSGSDQAREGRLVDALAVRGDEGRDTLR